MSAPFEPRPHGSRALVSLSVGLALALVVVGAPTSHAQAPDTTILRIAPSQVPDEQPPRVVADAPDGLGPDAWQGPPPNPNYVQGSNKEREKGAKTNWHARYLANGDGLSILFPDDAAGLTIDQIAEISYWTKRPDGTPDGDDWWIQIYTRPVADDDWYNGRYTSNYGGHTATDTWTRYSTAADMTFGGLDLAGLAAQAQADGSTLVEMISLHTNSGWNGFDGLVDGLEIVLTNGKIGRVDFGAGSSTVHAVPHDIPDEEPPQINVGDAPNGFGPDSWQGSLPNTSGDSKVNWHARYMLNGDWLSKLFPTQAATLTIGDIAEISYYTKRPTNTPSGNDWWVQIYTRPQQPGDWYDNKFINNYQDHTNEGDWIRYSTANGMTFRDQSSGGASGLTLADLPADDGIEMLSVQTNSGWNGYNGYVDGLVIRLKDGHVGRVDFAAWHPEYDYYYAVIIPDPDAPDVLQSALCWKTPDGTVGCQTSGGVLVLGPPMCRRQGGI